MDHLRHVPEYNKQVLCYRCLPHYPFLLACKRYGKGKRSCFFSLPSDNFPELRKKFLFFVIFLFFFQAEDGILDVERSRGLGDVYKRQV